MNEYLKAIYQIAVSNNKFLVALEQRIMNLEHSMSFNEEMEPLEEHEVTEPNPM